ncbi:MAG: hypothetical protein KAI38_00320 [Candidatus Latescibacteria bacterium]|nr:hypothetical protein [Candidatus Latescibacterota bacterium]
MKHEMERVPRTTQKGIFMDRPYLWEDASEEVKRRSPFSGDVGGQNWSCVFLRHRTV